MRLLIWLVLVVAVGTLVAACATGPTQSSVAITTQIDFSGEAPNGTFEVNEGADVLGCSSGTFADSQTESGLHKEFTCESGTKTGTFTAEFSPPSGPWKIVDATDEFSGLSGEGDFSLAPASEVDEGTEVSLLDAETRTAVIDALVGQLKENYVFVDVAAKMEEDVRERQSKGEYDSITDRTAFAQALTDHLREVSHDGHLEVLPSAMGPPRESKRLPERFRRSRKTRKPPARTTRFHRLHPRKVTLPPYTERSTCLTTLAISRCPSSPLLNPVLEPRQHRL
jgi:hypothetical protein